MGFVNCLKVRLINIVAVFSSAISGQYLTGVVKRMPECPFALARESAHEYLVFLHKC